MSRVGKAPIAVPKGVEVSINGQDVSVKGPRGLMAMRIPDPRVTLARDGDILRTQCHSSDKKARAFYGLTSRLVSNMITGVTDGFRKQLEIRGVGYRAEMRGATLVMQLGHSHPIEYDPPEGVKIEVDKNQSLITVEGSDKQAVGQVAANIRGFRPPEPYKGKGVRYVGEYVRMLEGKKAAKA